MQDDQRDELTGDEATGDEATDTDDAAAKQDHGDSAPLPFAPHDDDDSPLGDTDQHSTA